MQEALSYAFMVQCLIKHRNNFTITGGIAYTYFLLLVSECLLISYYEELKLEQKYFPCFPCTRQLVQSPTKCTYSQLYNVTITYYFLLHVTCSSCTF